MHEASLYEQNCFITLTFNDDFVDPILSLQKSHFQNFMKRLRKYLSEYVYSKYKNVFLKKDDSLFCDVVRQAKRVRYFHAGEYGDEFGRPHHHAILFGYDFPDKILKRVENGFRYYESPLLSSLWSHPKTKESYGFHEITDVSYETCAYVARYVCKKINGEGYDRNGKFISADDHYTIFDEQGNAYKRLPEFCTMSRRPGIGLGWYEKYKDTDVWAHDRIHIRGSTFVTPPRYYGNKFELDCPEEYAKIKEKRLKKCKDNPDNRFERQPVKEAVKKAQYSMLKRSLK